MKHKQSLLMKLLFLFLISATVPTILIGVLSISSATDTLWKNTVHSTEQMVDQVKKSIGSLFEDAEYFLKIGEEHSVVAYLGTNDNDYENAKKILEVFEIYSGNCGFDKNVNNIYAVSCDGKMISARYGVSKIDKASFSLFDWDSLMSYSGKAMVAAGNINPSHFYADSSFLYIAMPLVVKPLRDPFGAVIIELKDTIIADFCNSVDIAGKGFFTVYSAEGEPIFRRREQPDESISRQVLEKITVDDAGSFMTRQQDEDILILYDTIPNTDWKLVGQISVNDLMADVNDVKRSLTIVLLTVIPLGFLGYLVLTRQLIKPLKKLQAVMKMVGLGEKNIRFETKVQDEIGVVGESFNQMIDKLENMNRQALKNQATLQKASLDLMQAQINPHFLYNTLETIIWSANAQDTQKVISLVDALASFYRATLSGGESYITVAEEIRMTEHYIFIQKSRYQDRISEEIETDPAILDKRMLKLTLQPIVENAICHGMQGREGRKRLKITGREDGAYMVFQVIDNGTGIAPDKLRSIRERLLSGEAELHAKEGGGFGLENVNARIRLYYGDDCGLSVENGPSGGTIVTIRLKKM